MAAARTNRNRRRSRGRFGPLLKLLCALAVVAALTVGATVFFQVEAIVVSGNSRYTQEEIISVTGIQMGDNLFGMNKFQIARQLLQRLPYVQEIMIRRSLPSTIVISVTEWDAVARVEMPPAAGGAYQDEVPLSGGEDLQGDASNDGQADKEIAAQAWLISVGGKLLEPAPADSAVLSVTGITPLLPRAGTMLALPLEEQARLDALLALLESLNSQGMLADVSSIEIGASQLAMRYLNRFDVKLALNADFSYKLRALVAAVEETQEKLGDQTAGTFDLSKDDYTAVYSPE